MLRTSNVMEVMDAMREEGYFILTGDMDPSIFLEPQLGDVSGVHMLRDRTTMSRSCLHLLSMDIHLGL